jgi:hypothetical protein
MATQTEADVPSDAPAGTGEKIRISSFHFLGGGRAPTANWSNPWRPPDGLSGIMENDSRKFST